MNSINHNGQIIPENQPVFDIGNRAFRYGDAVFETIRVLNGRICFFNHHFDRLSVGLKLLQMQFVVDRQALLEQVNKLIQVNGVTQGGRIRITIYRNSGGYYTPSTNTCSYVIEVNSIDSNQFMINDNGLTIDLYETHRKTINEISTIKSTNCLTYILAAQYKLAKGLDDCVLLNELGSIAECVSSNLFVAYNGVLYTPSLNQGIVPGIMRQQIIDLSREIGMEVQECPLSPQVLHRADEVFLTNSIAGITWVGAYRSKRYFNKVSKKLIEELNKKLSSRMDQLETLPS